MTGPGNSAWPTIGPYPEYPEGPEIRFLHPMDASSWAEGQKQIIQPLVEATTHVGLGMGIAANSWLQQLNQIIDVSNNLRVDGPNSAVLVEDLKNLFESLGSTHRDLFFLSVNDPRVEDTIMEMRNDPPVFRFAAILLASDRSDLVVEAVEQGSLKSEQALVMIWRSAGTRAIKRTREVYAALSKRANQIEQRHIDIEVLNSSLINELKSAKMASAEAARHAMEQGDVVDNFRTQAKEALDHVESLRKTLDETIRVSSSNTYWENRARRAHRQEWFWIFSLVLFIGILGCIGVQQWSTIVSFIADLPAERAAFTIGVLIVLPAVVFLMLVRFLLRQQQRYAQIADDAAFRRSLILTHLSLVADGKALPDYDRVLVLQALFRSLTPTSEAEASPATLIEALAKNISSAGRGGTS